MTASSIRCEVQASARDRGADEALNDGGTQGALQAFLTENYGRLRDRLVRHLGCPEAASECLHDAWVRLGDRAPAQTVLSPEAYVYRVACNLAMDRIRADRPWGCAGDAELDFMTDPAPALESIVQARTELAAVERALLSLPDRHRSVLIALRIEDMTREQVALRCGLSVRRVDTVLRQALDHCTALSGRIEAAAASSCASL